jgi:hypothetical protein
MVQGGRNQARTHLSAMLAVVGFIVADLVRIPGDMYSFSAVPKAAVAHDDLLGKGPVGQLLLWIGLWELIVTTPRLCCSHERRA